MGGSLPTVRGCWRSDWPWNGPKLKIRPKMRSSQSELDSELYGLLHNVIILFLNQPKLLQKCENIIFPPAEKGSW